MCSRSGGTKEKHRTNGKENKMDMRRFILKLGIMNVQR